MTKISNQYSLTNILTADLANSRLGINNVSPTVALDVTGAGKFSGVTTVKSCSIVSTNGYSGQIIQQGDIFGTSATNLLIQSSTSNGIGFLTNGGTTFNMFINSSGNVGIGTTSPTSFGGGYRTLAVAGTGTEGGIIQTIVGSTSALYIGTNSSQCFFAEPRNVFMTFGTNDTERMRITAAGNVGIGNTAYANTRVTITGISTTSSNYGLVVNNSSNSNLFLVRDDGAVTAVGTVNALSFYSTTGFSYPAIMTWTTFYTIPSDQGMYTISIGFGNNSIETWYAYGTVFSAVSTCMFQSLTNGSLVQMRSFGMAIQVLLLSGAGFTRELTYKILRS